MSALVFAAVVALSSVSAVSTAGRIAWIGPDCSFSVTGNPVSGEIWIGQLEDERECER